MFEHVVVYKTAAIADTRLLIGYIKEYTANFASKFHVNYMRIIFFAD